MSKFIENVKNYLDVRNIRQTYVALMTGWDRSRVSKVLSGTIELKESKSPEINMNENSEEEIDTTHKKEMGMMAMSYRNVYVASVALYADMSQTIKAFNEETPKI